MGKSPVLSEGEKAKLSFKDIASMLKTNKPLQVQLSAFFFVMLFLQLLARGIGFVSGVLTWFMVVAGSVPAAPALIAYLLPDKKSLVGQHCKADLGGA